MELRPWRIAGSYFESCNCDAICPCRRVNGVPGGRSTHGICMGVLCWTIEEGRAGTVELAGLNVALALRYDDDEAGSPWEFLLYLDERADPAQRGALEEVYTGRLGGDALEHFPWAWKPSRPLGVKAARIEVDQTPRRQWLRVVDEVTVRIAGAAAEEETVTCVIPGHHREGEELVADELRVVSGELEFSYSGVCGYGSTFDYTG